MPVGLVAFMRQRLDWDVLFVLEEPDLRRARDTQHFRLARQLRRTLVTLDHDYLDERVFPAAESPGVIVVTAPDERGLSVLLARLDRTVLRSAEHGPARPMPLGGRKLHVHPDWMGPSL
jgi:hypothetical protein